MKQQTCERCTNPVCKLGRKCPYEPIAKKRMNTQKIIARIMKRMK